MTLLSRICWKKLLLLDNLFYAGHDDKGAAALLYVADSGEGHSAGDGRAEVAAFSGIPVLASLQEVAGMSGHSA